jgi:hypothetical protein
MRNARILWFVLPLRLRRVRSTELEAG